MTPLTTSNFDLIFRESVGFIADNFHSHSLVISRARRPELVASLMGPLLDNLDAAWVRHRDENGPMPIAELNAWRSGWLELVGTAKVRVAA